MGDKIATAIDATKTPAEPVGVRVRLSSGRTVLLGVPPDIAVAEAYELVGYIAGGGLAAQLAEAKATAKKPALDLLRVPAMPSGVHQRRT